MPAWKSLKTGDREEASEPDRWSWWELMVVGGTCQNFLVGFLLTVLGQSQFSNGLFILVHGWKHCVH